MLIDFIFKELVTRQAFELPAIQNITRDEKTKILNMKVLTTDYQNKINLSNKIYQTYEAATLKRLWMILVGKNK